MQFASEKNQRALVITKIDHRGKGAHDGDKNKDDAGASGSGTAEADLAEDGKEKAELGDLGQADELSFFFLDDGVTCSQDLIQRGIRVLQVFYLFPQLQNLSIKAGVLRLLLDKGKLLTTSAPSALITFLSELFVQLDYSSFKFFNLLVFLVKFFFKRL